MTCRMGENTSKQYNKHDINFYTNSSYSSISKNNTIKTWTEDPNRTFFEEDIQMSKGT